MIEMTSSKLWLINFYREQLSKFYKLGMGEKTEHNVVVSDRLINATKKRLERFLVVYDSNASDQALYQRRQLKKRKEKLINGQQSNDNGTISKSREQSNSSS